MINDGIFEFERDFAISLRCVPMAVRLKLDLCGVKLSLRQWSRFTPADRRMLLNQPCETPNETDAFGEDLRALITQRCEEPVKELTEDVDATAWDNSTRVAPVVADYARSVGIMPPHLSQWAMLTPLQRFALIKLTRDRHENINFLPAMMEFGIVDRPFAQ